MTTTRRIVAGVLPAALSAVLAACGGGGGFDAPARPTAAAHATPSATSGAATRRAPGPEGVVHVDFPHRDHVEGHVAYRESPPFGGNHNPVWADCTGTVYTGPVPNENAVHSLEHGAVWITYRPGLDADDVAALTSLVRGVDYTFSSPYPGLGHAVSIQSWGYQLATDDVHDPRLREFLLEFRENPRTTPEYGATCADPDFPRG